MRFFAKLIIKFILIILIICFALINYRVLSIDKGLSVFQINNNSSITAIDLIKAVPTKIEYYKKTIVNNEYDYMIFIETRGQNYLFEASYEQIFTLDILGVFANNIKPQEIKPIPFYVEIIVGFIVLIIPFGRSRKKE